MHVQYTVETQRGPGYLCRTTRIPFCPNGPDKSLLLKNEEYIAKIVFPPRKVIRIFYYFLHIVVGAISLYRFVEGRVLSGRTLFHLCTATTVVNFAQTGSNKTGFTARSMVSPEKNVFLLKLASLWRFLQRLFIHINKSFVLPEKSILQYK